MKIEQHVVLLLNLSMGNGLATIRIVSCTWLMTAIQNISLSIWESIIVCSSACGMKMLLDSTSTSLKVYVGGGASLSSGPPQISYMFRHCIVSIHLYEQMGGWLVTSCCWSFHPTPTLLCLPSTKKKTDPTFPNSCIASRCLHISTPCTSSMLLGLLCWETSWTNWAWAVVPWYI